MITRLAHFQKLVLDFFIIFFFLLLFLRFFFLRKLLLFLLILLFLNRQRFQHIIRLVAINLLHLLKLQHRLGHGLDLLLFGFFIFLLKIGPTIPRLRIFLFIQKSATTCIFLQKVRFSNRRHRRRRRLLKRHLPFFFQGLFQHLLERFFLSGNGPVVDRFVKIIIPPPTGLGVLPLSQTWLGLVAYGLGLLHLFDLVHFVWRLLGSVSAFAGEIVRRLHLLQKG